MEMSSSTITRTRVDLEHPYRVVGIIVILLSLITLAFSLGVLARCGAGEGVCFDASTHGSADAGLVVFVIMFVIGIALIAYTGATASMTARTVSPPSTTNVYTQPPAPQPTVTNVYPQSAPAAQPATTVVVNPRA